MKKFLPVICMALILFGCKKDAQLEQVTVKNEDVLKYPVSFQVQNFKQITAPMSVSDKQVTATPTDIDIRDYLDKITYRFYNSKGDFVKSVTQEKTNSFFGTLVETLPQDTYDVAILGYKGILNMQDNIPYHIDGFSLDKDRDGFTVWDDTFIKRIKVTVNKSTSNQTVTLSRCIGAFEIIIEDAVPANVSKIRILNYYEDTRQYMNGAGTFGGLGGVHKDYFIKPEDVGTKNKVLLFYSGSLNAPTILDIIAYDKNNNPIATKTIVDTRVIANQKTKYNGFLFSNSAGFSVGIAAEWNVPGIMPGRF